MAKKAGNYFKRVAKYQKEHPRADRQKAMAAVSKEIAGAKKSVGSKKAVGTKKAAPRKRSITKTERISTVGKISRKRSSNPIQRGVGISKKIADLEILLKNTSGNVAKNHVKRLINAEHDKLDMITKNLKSA